MYSRREAEHWTGGTPVPLGFGAEGAFECRKSGDGPGGPSTRQRLKARFLESRVKSVDQRGGARIDQQSVLHLVHGVAEANFLLWIGESQRAAGSWMAEGFAARTE